MSTPTTLTSRQVRSEFWKVHPQFRRGMMRQNGNWRQKTHNEHNATTQSAFVEFVDGLALSSEARMVEWKGHFTVGKREPFLKKMQRRDVETKRLIVTREPANGRRLLFHQTADMEQIAKDQPWILHGSHKHWTISHSTTSLKLCSSTSVAGVIQRVVAILSAQTDEKLTKAFRT